MSLVSFIVITGFLGMVGLLAAGVILGRREFPATIPGDDRTELHYCQGCGCRHRRMYMEFRESGAYRCVACCYDKVA